MDRGVKFWGCAAIVGLSLGSTAAFAQRADENVVAEAEDAFGTRVGGENIGLYSPNSARGFNPQLAGNVRIEGLYFDQQAFLGRAIARSTSMRVGLSAQSYPFAAPTGIADTSLFIPDGPFTTSVAHEFRRPTGLNFISVDVKAPITDTLNFHVGSVGFQSIGEGGARGQNWNIASIMRWRPTGDLEVIPFTFFQRSEDVEVAPSVFTAGAFLPPRIDQHEFYGQHWADRSTDDLNYGVIVRGTPWANWRLQGGVFRSDVTRPKSFVIFYRNVQQSGVGTLDILRYPEHYAMSYSGEVRASGVYTTGRFRHTIHIAARARDTERLFGGGTSASFGAATIGVYRDIAEPTYAFNVRDKDAVRQVTPGVSYVGQWANVGEFSVGLQKSFYRRNFGKLNVAPTTTESRPWLYNGTLAYYVTPALALYASYTRGLEEFGTAPDNAVNGGEPLPAQLTKQVDGGVRYTIKPGLTLMAGVFEVSKPYFDRDPGNVYTVVGNLRHRGVEVSLTGRPIPGLTVVAGTVLLQARVSGLPVEQGLIGEVSPGTTPRIIRINMQYTGPTWDGFVVEGQLDHEGSQMANRANTLKIPSLTTLQLGVRYPFTVGETHATARLSVSNVFNTFGWTVDGNSGRFAPATGRQFFARIAADF